MQYYYLIYSLYSNFHSYSNNVLYSCFLNSADQIKDYTLHLVDLFIFLLSRTASLSFFFLSFMSLILLKEESKPVVL